MSDLKDSVRQQFGTHAEAYVRSQDHARGESLERLVELTRPQPDWTVLDVATGGGHTALAFAPRVARVVASDLTPAMLDAAERHAAGRGAANVEFVVADAEGLPFPDAAFDLLTCRVAPHHFPDVRRFVREAARVVRPGGLVAVVDNVVPADPEVAAYVNAFEKVHDPSHHWAYSLEEWISFFEDAGLVVGETETFRKRRDLEEWAGRSGCTPETLAELKRLLLEAPPAARACLEPDDRQGRLGFHLTEGLLIGRKPHAASSGRATSS
ncbi:class I SAM-dependent methyltransferase [Limnochorda pilosa]|uniref:Methylase n=1 Tax=Limnochorda pilosa TaxID=1555112 RepID=A0A0K2SQ04_LIMPI|nr:methyltransferase domain-containing protein [Limnochorda pilosa]BAS29198.1 methylase [Limnochorda pilosa]